MSARKRTPAPKKKPNIPVGALVPQAHGGALRNGGTNRGGPGRPPEHLRMRSREVFEKWLDWAGVKVLVKGACTKCGRSAEEPSDDVMNQIGKTAGRFGFPPEDMVSRQYVRDLLQKQVDVISNTLSVADADRLLSALHALWFPA